MFTIWLKYIIKRTEVLGLKVLRVLERFVGKKWYPLLVVVLAAADAYIFVIPVEALLIPAVLIQPRYWVLLALGIAAASAVGSTSFAILASQYGEIFVEKLVRGASTSTTWQNTAQLIQDHTFWGLTLVSMSPLPQHIAVAIAGLAHVPAGTIFGAILLGRTVKYLLIAGLSIHAPKTLVRLGIIPKK
jgi:membrane protein YqaA with SNARE-associated domain